MKKFATLLLGAAVFGITGSAMAAPVAPPRWTAAVQAYRQAVREDCQSGVFVPSELHRLYRAARAKGYQGYLASPQFAEEACEQAP